MNLNQRHDQRSNQCGCAGNERQLARAPFPHHKTHRFADDHAGDRCHKDGEESKDPGDQAGQIGQHSGG